MKYIYEISNSLTGVTKRFLYSPFVFSKFIIMHFRKNCKFYFRRDTSKRGIWI